MPFLIFNLLSVVVEILHLNLFSFVLSSIRLHFIVINAALNVVHIVNETFCNQINVFALIDSNQTREHDKTK